MSGTPVRVSVIIPAYNAAETLRDAIDSVLAQTYPAYEIIVVDDGSRDATAELAQAYREPVRLIRQTNAGPAAARNAGIAAASGELIAFLDADDVWLPSKLGSQVAFLASHPHYAFVFTAWHVWPPDRPIEKDLARESDVSIALDEEESGWLYSRLLDDCLVFTSTVLARRELIDRVGLFDESLKRGQDYDYWLRASRLTPIAKLKEPLALYRVAGSNIIRVYSNENYVIRVLEQNVRRYGLANPDGGDAYPAASMRKRLGDAWFSFGVYHHTKGDAGIAVAALTSAIRARPINAKAYIYLMLAFARRVARFGRPAAQ